MSSFKISIKKAGLVSAISISMAAFAAGAFAADPTPADPNAVTPAAGAPAAGAPNGGGPRGGGRMIQVATIPVTVLDPALKLTADEKTKIGDIETKLQTDTKALMPAPGAQVDRQTRRQNMQQAQQLTQTASDAIQALLTDDQKTALAALLKDLQALNLAGISPAALGELNLTDAVKAQIITIGNDAMTDLRTKMQAANGDRTQFGAIRTQVQTDARTKAAALLTDDQKAIVAKYPAQNGFGGGRGGRGGNGGGGNGGGGNGGGGAGAPATPPAAQ